MTTAPPTRATATSRIAAGYQRDPTEHVAQRLARAWSYDEDAERLLALSPDKRESLPQATRLGLGYYSGAKTCARTLGVDVSAPEDPA